MKKISLTLLWYSLALAMFPFEFIIEQKSALHWAYLRTFAVAKDKVREIWRVA